MLVQDQPGLPTRYCFKRNAIKHSSHLCAGPQPSPESSVSHWEESSQRCALLLSGSLQWLLSHFFLGCAGIHKALIMLRIQFSV